MCVIVALL